ncbi:uncharacterized protein SPPG_06471 [Spizellomyces punctatus DAOM BR117]|uniref:Uncharacterized protein n=1 Tax=Spizellomyces punctatus (strain DAOM BR117) TaxID=645134 RepID=A0A0L0HA55_SPIPD|nr:uncharacterized protein SPPG_06471 [Spizellomyces punctatus DAOM BR117]KNC98057.1 hypothetical protein SPPG_06471 [Spizellomyces punctatus DAOM BR117]|eukprot:XP_016606097.1 hypothetical protein SPPG_06471 [Spizellomyces punctatus DAOM BR117]
MLQEYISASEALWAILDETTGIRPIVHKHEITEVPQERTSPGKTSTSKSSSSIKPLNIVECGHDCHTTYLDGHLPPLPGSDPGKKHLPKTEHKMNWNKSHHKAQLVLSDVSDEEEEGIFLDPEVDPWAEADLSWSDEAPTLKKLYMSQRQWPRKKRTASQMDFSKESILGYFRTLRLHDRKIGYIDRDIMKMRNLEELSLTGNWIDHVNSLPTRLQILHLNANRLSKCPNVSALQQLVHLGIGYNSIASFLDVELRPESPPKSSSANPRPRKLSPLSGSKPSTTLGWLPPSLKSLDASWNAISDLNETLEVLEQLPSLKILALTGNPAFLLPKYRASAISRLPGLVSLDDTWVTAEERTTSLRIVREDARDEVCISFGIHTLTGFSIPESVIPEDPKQPLDEYTFQLRIVLERFNGYAISTPAVSPPQRVHQPPDKPHKSGKGKGGDVQPPEPEVHLVDFAFVQEIEFPIGKQLRDALWDGVTVILSRNRVAYVRKDDLAPDENDTSTRPDSSAATSRRPSLSGKKGGSQAGRKPAKAAKGRKGAKEDEAANWRPVIAERTDIGLCRVSTKPFLDGENVIEQECDLTIPVKDSHSPTSSTVVGTVHLSFRLNPLTEERAGGPSDENDAPDGVRLGHGHESTEEE